ncbi:hypothetical protein EIP86_011090 [Pleurotus ostreatoroseus]|nr:hypothetical protein EIP86_011090 [Pleurotus ostreatoroseus]
MLQDNVDELQFATDNWTSPNHRAYMALVVFFNEDDLSNETTAALVDVVEVAESHKGRTLAEVFSTVLEEFGISDKAFKLYP